MTLGFDALHSFTYASTSTVRHSLLASHLLIAFVFLTFPLLLLF